MLKAIEDDDDGIMINDVDDNGVMIQDDDDKVPIMKATNVNEDDEVLMMKAANFDDNGDILMIKAADADDDDGDDLMMENMTSNKTNATSTMAAAAPDDHQDAVDDALRYFRDFEF
mmetsp:Transcript_54480/g.65685  ORF Transcript_54480/g.65685 Transcript_54480/m.65685 type:complete len:116 (-) Transcript_54480:85-432(-)